MTQQPKQPDAQAVKAPPTAADVVNALDAASDALVQAAADFLAAGDRDSAASANDSSSALLRLASKVAAQDVITQLGHLKETEKRLGAVTDAINAEAAKIKADQQSLKTAINIVTDFTLVIAGAASAQPLNAVGPLVDLLKSLGVPDPGV